jgi:glycosyltransferase involved in cell wall biosynthesis
MKIVHLSTYDTGGAGIASIRLHHALIEHGVDSAYFSLFGNNQNVANHFVQAPIKTLTISKVLNHLGFPTTQAQKNWQKTKHLKGLYEMLSFPETDYRPELHPAVKEADIVHLHFVSNFIHYPSFFKAIQKPIVWTLHDMNPFMGCFHYQNDLTQNKNFEALNQAFQEGKEQALKAVKNLQIVSPSDWLLKLSQKSEVLGKFKHTRIYNGLDGAVFKPMPTMEVRQSLNLPDDKIIFLFVAENVLNKRKGFSLLLEAIQEICKTHSNVLFLALGKNPQPEANLPIQFLGHISYESELAKIYNAADAFILPSLEDNLPNTMLESLMCGTPVIGFKTGGVEDIIAQSEFGILAETKDVIGLKNAIVQYFTTPHSFKKETISELSQTKFAKEIVATQYMHLYQSMAKLNN